MSQKITFPIADQEAFDRAVAVYNTNNPPEPEPVVDPIQLFSSSNITLSDITKRIFLVEGTGTKNITISSDFNDLPNGTELKFIRFDSAVMNVIAGDGVSIAGVGSNGATTAPIERITMIKFGPAAWLLYSYAPYVA